MPTGGVTVLGAELFGVGLTLLEGALTDGDGDGDVETGALVVADGGVTIGELAVEGTGVEGAGVEGASVEGVVPALSSERATTAAASQLDSWLVADRKPHRPTAPEALTCDGEES